MSEVTKIVKSMTVSESRKNFARTLDAVVDDREEVVITRAKGNVVIVSEDEYRSMQETLHLLSSPANAEHLRRGVEQLESGRGLRRSLDDD